MIIKNKARLDKEDIYLNLIIAISSHALIQNYIIDSDEFNQCCRAIGNTLYDYPVNYTGYASKLALSTKYKFYKEGKKYSFSYDHIWPRQYAGRQILLTAYNYSIPLKSTIIDLVTQFSQVRYVTKQENNQLVKFQNAKQFEHPDISYKQAGVECVEWPANTKITKLEQLYPELVNYTGTNINNNC